MVPNKQAEIDELFSRLYSADLSVDTLDVINGWRVEQAAKREAHARELAEMAANSTVKIARVLAGQVNVQGTLRPTEYIDQIINVAQKDIPEFARAYGLKLPDLLATLESKQKEVVGRDGVKYQRYPLTWTDQTANKQAQAELDRAIAEDYAYMDSVREKLSQGVRQVPMPLVTAWSKKH